MSEVFMSQVKQICKETLEYAAEQQCFMDVPEEVDVKVSDMGMAAGKAVTIGDACTIEINSQLEVFPVSVWREVIIHEVSHLLCFLNGLDDDHGEMWQDINKLLGGSGEPTIDIYLKPF